MKNNKGFSLVELIIVMAIMAILVGLLAPMYVGYVDRAKKQTDVTNANKLVHAMGIAAVELGGNSLTKFEWGKNYTMPAVPSNVCDATFRLMGNVPVSKYDEDLVWCVTFETSGYRQVKGIYLIETAGNTTGYRLYPDASQFLDGTKVNVE